MKTTSRHQWAPHLACPALPVRPRHHQTPPDTTRQTVKVDFSNVFFSKHFLPQIMRKSNNFPQISSDGFHSFYRQSGGEGVEWSAGQKRTSKNTQLQPVPTTHGVVV